MQLAVENGQPDLARRIESLTDRAWGIYRKQIGLKPGGGVAQNETMSALPRRGEKP
jgi:hypothetical protein